MRCAGLLLLLAALAAPASAHGHAWSAPVDVGPSASPGARYVLGAAGDDGGAAVVWATADGDQSTVFAAQAPPGGPFGPPAVLLKGTGLEVHDAALGNGGVLGVAVMSGDARGGSAVIVRRSAVASPVVHWAAGWEADVDAAGDTLAAIQEDTDGLVLHREASGPQRRGEPGPDGPGGAALGVSGFGPSVAVGDDRVFVAWSDGTDGSASTYAGEVGEDLSSARRLALRGRIAAGPGGRLLLSGVRHESVAATTAPPGGSFGPVRTIAHPSGFEVWGDVAANGTAGVAWGLGASWVAPDAESLFALGPPGGAIAAVPPTTMISDGRMDVAFDGRSRLVATGRHIREAVGGGGFTRGRVAVATRVGGAWCAPEIVSEDHADYGGVDVAFGAGDGGVAAWRDEVRGVVRAARYTARDDCPPAPPRDPDPVPEWFQRVADATSQHVQQVLAEQAAAAPVVEEQRPRTAPAVAPLLLPRAVRMGRSGIVRLRTACRRPVTCRGTLELRRGTRSLARAPVAIRARASRTLRLRVAAAHRRGITRRRAVRATLVARMRGERPARRTVTLRRAR